MSLIKNGMRIAASAFAFGMATAAIAGTIVIRAEGPSKGAYPPGKSLAGRITLARGDTLVVLDQKGTRTLNGPGTIDLAATGGTTSSALSALMKNSGARQVRTGAVRGGLTVAATSPNLWYVDISRGGTICLPDFSRAVLWRKSMTEPAALTLTRVRDGKAVPLTFASGQSVRSWPVNDLALAEATEYRLAGVGIASPVTIRFANIGAPGDTPDSVASALIGKGCTTQLDLLVSAAGAPGIG